MFLLTKPVILQSGSSLVETLLVVIISVIVSGILAQSILYNVHQNEIKAQDAIRKDDLKEISQLLSRYILEKGYYPPADNVKIDGWHCYITIAGNNDCRDLKAALSEYTAQLPFDPLDKPVPGGNNDCASSPCYQYITPDKKHQNYCLCGQLEKTPDIPKSDYCQSFNTYGNYCLEGHN